MEGLMKQKDKRASIYLSVYKKCVKCATYVNKLIKLLNKYNI